jgi:hypothetical protein
MEGRGTGVWGMTMQGGGQAFNYGWPKYGPVSSSASRDGEEADW